MNFCQVSKSTMSPTAVSPTIQPKSNILQSSSNGTSNGVELVNGATLGVNHAIAHDVNLALSSHPIKQSLGNLQTERENLKTTNIDTVSSLELCSEWVGGSCDQGPGLTCDQD